MHLFSRFEFRAAGRLVFLALLIFCTGLVLGTGCGSSLPLVGSKEIRLKITAREDLNSGGNAMVVRVYKLAADINFQLATLESFWEDDETTLGPELLEKREITLLPGETHYLTFELEADSTYIAAAGHFFSPNQEQWREVYRLGTNAEEWVWGHREIWLEVGSEKLALRQLGSPVLPPPESHLQAGQSGGFLHRKYGPGRRLRQQSTASLIHLDIAAREDLNSGGNALVVRVYELSDSVSFQAAAFAALWTDDTGALGADLIERQEFTLVPGESRQLEIQDVRQARFIGLAAHFFRPAGESWRMIYSPVAGKTTEVEAGVAGLSVKQMNVVIKPL